MVTFQFPDIPFGTPRSTWQASRYATPGDYVLLTKTLTREQFEKMFQQQQELQDTMQGKRVTLALSTNEQSTRLFTTHN